MSDSFPQIVYHADEVSAGDVISYPGKGRGRGGTSDWLRVARVDEHGLHGPRVYGRDWERECEFVVTMRQIADNGVEIVERTEALELPEPPDAS